MTGCFKPRISPDTRIRTAAKNRSYIQILDTALSSDSEEVSGDESTDKEDWTCQEYLNDNGLAADYVRCDTCEHWFHKNFAWKSELDVFSCKFCLEN